MNLCKTFLKLITPKIFVDQKVEKPNLHCIFENLKSKQNRSPRSSHKRSFAIIFATANPTFSVGSLGVSEEKDVLRYPILLFLHLVPPTHKYTYWKTSANPCFVGFMVLINKPFIMVLIRINEPEGTIE
jgi:hypothetical protein